MRDKLPFVSVVIPTYNRAARLGECLDSLFEQDYPKDRYEVVLVNDGSKDQTEEVLRGYSMRAPCGFKWVTQKNSGISAATNAGIKIAKGEIICFTGDDCVAVREWISCLVDGFVDDKVGGVGGRIISVASKSIAQRYTEDVGLLRQEKFTAINFLITGSAAYRKEVLDSMGGFDNFLRGCTDIDISIQTQLLGYSLGYNPLAIIYHNHPATIQSLFRQQYRISSGFAQLHKKYTYDFNPGYNILTLLYRIIWKILTYPVVLLKVFFREDKVYYLLKPVLDLIILSTNLLGIINETLFGKPYPREKLAKKLNFVEDQSINKLFKKFKSKFI